MLRNNTDTTLGAGSVSTRGGNNTLEYEGSGTNLQATLSSDQRLEIDSILGASSLSQQQQTAVQAAITNAFTQYGDYVNFQPGSPAYNALVAAVAAQVGNTGGGGVSQAAIATALANYFAANPAQCGCDLPAFQAQLIEHIIAQLTEVPTGDEDDGNPIYNQLTQAVRDVAELALADSGIASDLYDTMDRVTALEGAQLIGDWSALSSVTTISELTAALQNLTTTTDMPPDLVTALTSLKGAYDIAGANATDIAGLITGANAVMSSITGASFANQPTPFDYLVGNGTSGIGVFATAAALKVVVGLEGDLLQPLTAYGVFKSSPVDAVRQKADIMFADYQKMLLRIGQYYLKAATSADQTEKNAADTAATAATAACAQSTIDAMSAMVSGTSFVLPTAVTTLLDTLPLIQNTKQLRELFVKLSAVAAQHSWWCDPNNQLSWYFTSVANAIV